MHNITIPRQFKPPIGTQLDLTNELVNGLFYFAPLWEAGGSTAADVAGRKYAAITAPAWLAGTRSVALNCNSTSPLRYATQTVPGSLQFAQWPATIAFGFRFMQGFSGSPNFFGIQYKTSGVSPYRVICLFQYGSSTLGTLFNSAGTAKVGGPYYTFTVNTDYVVSFSVGNNNQDLYLNGTNISSLTNAILAPDWDPTSRFVIGDPVVSAPGILVYWAGAWTRYLTPAQHAMLAQNVWQVFQPVWTAATFPQGTAGPQLTSSVRIHRPAADYTGSRRAIWAE